MVQLPERRFARPTAAPARSGPRSRVHRSAPAAEVVVVLCHIGEGWLCCDRELLACAAGSIGVVVPASGDLGRPARSCCLLRRGASPSWAAFLCRQAASFLECGFHTLETVFSRRLLHPLLLRPASRRVHLAGVTANPDGVGGLTQQSRNLLMRLPIKGRGRVTPRSERYVVIASA